MEFIDIENRGLVIINAIVSVGEIDIVLLFATWTVILSSFSCGVSNINNKHV